MSSKSAQRARARELAAQYIEKRDPTGWFEPLYREARSGRVTIPWADGMPNPNLTEFWAQKNISIPVGAAVVIGCGLGDDAEWLSQRGFTTTAFDISPSAVGGARERFPKSNVRYVVADLLNPPGEWIGQFDFVLESYTLQVLPSSLRKRAAKRIADLTRPGRLALVITRAREEADPLGQMPWPLTRRDLDQIAAAGLTEISFEDYYDSESPRVRRFRALFEKTG